MAALGNAKHEAFARAIVLGRSQREAYRAAGFKPKSDGAADAGASRLVSDVKVAARVAELKSAAADATVMDLREVLAEQSKIGRANMRDFAHLGTSDNIVADIAQLTPEQSAAIQEITVESYTEPGDGPAADEALEHQPQGGALKRRKAKKPDVRVVKRIKFKLHSKAAALAELRAHHEPQKHEHTGKDGRPIAHEVTGELSELDLARRIAFALEQAARKAPVAAAAAPKPKKKG